LNEHVSKLRFDLRKTFDVAKCRCACNLIPRGAAFVYMRAEVEIVYTGTEFYALLTERLTDFLLSPANCAK